MVGAVERRTALHRKNPPIGGGVSPCRRVINREMDMPFWLALAEAEIEA